MSVVYCIFGGDRGTAFLALLVSPQIYVINGREYKIVIVPTAPVPFGGGLLFVPIECVHAADMSVDGLMSIYVSMGVTAPQFMHRRSRLLKSNDSRRHQVDDRRAGTAARPWGGRRAGRSTRAGPGDRQCATPDSTQAWHASRITLSAVTTISHVCLRWRSGSGDELRLPRPVLGPAATSR